MVGAVISPVTREPSDGLAGAGPGPTSCIESCSLHRLSAAAGRSHPYIVRAVFTMPPAQCHPPFRSHRYEDSNYLVRTP